MKTRANFVFFVLFFALPLAAVSLYLLRYATDRYHSEASIIITQEQGTAQTLDLSAIGLPAPANGKDPLVLIQFVTSLDMLTYLDQRLKLRNHYSAPGIDWWWRLPAGASTEDFHGYIGEFLTAGFDSDAQLITIHVEAFDRGFARGVLEAVLARSQEFVDKLNARVTTEQTAFFEKQLTASEQRVREVKSELLKFQRENRLLSTDAQAALVTANIGELEKLLLQKQGELITRLNELNESSPVIQVLRSEIASLKQQLVEEKDRLSGESALAVSELDSRFRDIQFNLEFVTNIYKSNLAQLEQVRIEAVQRLKYLIVVTQPTLADASLYPDRVFIIGTAAMLLFMLFFVLSLIVAIVREHN